jgi:hypothetical protein
MLMKLCRDVPCMKLYQIVQNIPFHAELWLLLQKIGKTLKKYFSETTLPRA